tara:strand:+ start:33081 stop:34709 length:1629 start_codon:yes stop_codon:yes gene_type:complete
LTTLFCQITEHEKNENFIKIWGLLKYHHPEISNGKFDFNADFIKEYQKLKTIKSKEEFSKEMIQWIEIYGLKNLKIKENPYTKTLFTKNVSFEWINSSGFSPKLSEILNNLKNNIKYNNYYAKVKKLSSSIDFSNDSPLPGFDALKKEHRLLFLASFWNAMHYWNVNIYLTDVPWKNVLRESLSDFNETGKENFEKAKEKLFSKLNDSHSDYPYSHTLTSIDKYPNFGGRIINDSLVITTIFNEKEFDEENLTIGDIIYTINNTNIKDFYQNKYSATISASNKNYLKRAIERTYLLASNHDSIAVQILKKNGENVAQYIKLSALKYPAEKYVRLRAPISENWKELTPRIGYINLNTIDKKGLTTAFDKFENSKGIVIDLRNYPTNITAFDVAKHLYPKEKIFLKGLASVQPAYGKYDFKPALNIINNPFKVGKNTKNYYKGIVVLLVDRTTASKAEWIGMAIQASPNCTTIGEQTFGAVMNRNTIKLLDATTIDFTGVGAFYPNDEGVQRKGLKLDLEIKEKALNYDDNLYIATAIKLINDN